MDNEAILDLALSVCEEFCDTIIMDPKNGSILLYVPKKYYAPIVTRLAKLEFIEVFKQKRRKYIVTCLQQLIDDIDTEIIIEEEDDDEEDGIF